MAEHRDSLLVARTRVGDDPLVEREHELARKAVLAEIFEDGKSAQSVKRAWDAAAKKRSSGCPSGPDRTKRRQEAEQEVLGCVV